MELPGTTYLFNLSLISITFTAVSVLVMLNSTTGIAGIYVSATPAPINLSCLAPLSVVLFAALFISVAGVLQLA